MRTNWWWNDYENAEQTCVLDIIHILHKFALWDRTTVDDHSPILVMLIPVYHPGVRQYIIYFIQSIDTFVTLLSQTYKHIYIYIYGHNTDHFTPLVLCVRGKMLTAPFLSVNSNSIVDDPQML